MNHPASLTTRLTLLFVLVSSAVLIGLAWVLHAAVERHFVEMDRGILQSKVTVLERLLSRPPAQEELPALKQSVDAMFRSDPGLQLFVETTGGSVLLSSPETTFPVERMRALAEGEAPSVFSWQTGESRYRGLVKRIEPELADIDPLIVTAAINIDHHDRFMDRYSRTLFVFIPIATVLSGLLGWWAARRGLSPLRLIQERAAAVTASQLSQRLPEESVPRELTGLAHELNCMLDRLEEAFRRLSNFSSDLAHEMRTPVSNLLTQTQVVLSRSRSAAEYQEVLASSAEELDRLSRVISDMLFLAKTENGMSIPSTQELRLHEEIADLFEFYDALAEEEGVTLSSSGQAVIHGNRLMLRRALSNLLSNALRYSRSGGHVGVFIRDRNGAVELTVENDGETIPAEELPRLFDRFYRGDPARRRDDSAGVGLGLAITQALVRAHSGTIRAESGDGVTRFVVELPRSAPMPS